MKHRLLITLLLLFTTACSTFDSTQSTGNPAGNPETEVSASEPTAAATLEQASAETTQPPTEPPSSATATQVSPTTPAPATETPANPEPSPLPQSVSQLPDPAGYAWELFASGLESPVLLTYAGDPPQAFVVEQPGRIRVLENGQLLPEPFLDISSQVSYVSERGLLGLAFHPGYPDPPYFYINYSDVNGDTVVARYRVATDNPNRADPNSAEQVLFVDQPYGNHNGGHLLFGPDGYLYIGLGDGGSAGDPEDNAQNPQNLLGTLLRIDVDGEFPYTIPADNPFVSGGGAPEIWAYGLRNPWRFSFDAATGELYIGDVGQNNWEEINFLPAGAGRGANFGWDYFEGTHPYEGSPPANAVLVMPIAEYTHNEGCSVTGGVVYRGQELPEWQGVYLYGDYCSGTVWGLVRDAAGNWQNAPLFASLGRVSSFGVDPAGEVYFLDYNGSIFRLVAR